ncbi:stage II sporulation protein E [Desulfuribacillus alkaliarsenatis]|uniref:Stage II sporulation protein E n=1 Tax=Desulfuribacillus alkaliarsenatis TaxID=766136 RepID=A0A1E5FYX1_9FIRM|nr:stage II sporulation protein E [Desulfuribacillus alkaliarsenatis]OEF95769.1 stage II sporulation protein E [Desulfuribacillus alkaliarsenatis]
MLARFLERVNFSSKWKDGFTNMKNSISAIAGGALFIYVVGFLLGKAIILNDLAPFAIAFFAVMLLRKPAIANILAVVITLGALTVSWQHAIYIGGAISLLMIAYGYLEKKGQQDVSLLPYQVLAATIISKVAVLYWLTELTNYTFVMAGLESALALLLTLIFVQAVPILFGRMTSRILKNEEIICVFILIASVLIGMSNWVWYGVHMDQIMGGLAIILLAYAGGAGIGAAIGVVIGLIMSLANPLLMSQIAIFAFAGLLAGLLKEGKKVYVMAGFFIGYITLSIYMRPGIDLYPVFVEIFSVFFLFSLVPKSVVNYITGLIPGTSANMWNQQEYKKKVKELVSGKVDRYGYMLGELATTFETKNIKRNQEADFQQLIEHVADISCQNCNRYNRCWQTEFYKTYQGFVDIFIRFESGETVSHQRLPKDLNAKCVDKKRLLEVLYQEFKAFQKEYYWKGQVEECRGLLAEQLKGISQVMGQLSVEISKEGLEFSKQEVEISRAMEKLGLSIQHAQIVSLEKGNIDIRVTKNGCGQRDECEKILAPMITDIVGENVSTKNKRGCNCANEECILTIASAPVYEVEYGFVSIGKGGTFVSGDSYEGIDLGNGKYVLAISDGMGNGQRAREESQAAIKLLKTLLQAGLTEDTAIKTINAALMLRSSEEMFATLDLAFINLFTGETKFMKVGSSPSFIKTGKDVEIVNGRSLPVGILHEIQYSLEQRVLKQGDYILMVSDGILDSIRHVNDKEDWLRRILLQISCDDPQEIADVIVEKVLRFNENEVIDDTTILVAKIMPYQPEWASISIPDSKKLVTA